MLIVLEVQKELPGKILHFGSHTQEIGYPGKEFWRIIAGIMSIRLGASRKKIDGGHT